MNIFDTSTSEFMGGLGRRSEIYTRMSVSQIFEQVSNTDTKQFVGGLGRHTRDVVGVGVMNTIEG